MDILVISDTHGRRHAIEQVFSQLNFRPSTVLFLGDGLRDLSVITGNDRYDGVSVFAVAGNCDDSIIFPSDEPEVRTVVFGTTRIVMMHGHTFDVKSGNTAAVRYALEQGADVLLYGHTHAPFFEYRRVGDRTILVGNPGSLGRPNGERAPTFGMLTIRDGKPLFSFTEL